MGVDRRGRLWDGGWRKSLTCAALGEVYSRRETLTKGGQWSFCHFLVTDVLLQRAWGDKRLGGL